MGRGLSEQQKTAIRWIGDELIWKEELRDQADDESRRYMGLFGAKCREQSRTPFSWASWARTLRRLQERGLIVHMGPGRGWRPTPSGWATYRQLTEKDVPIRLIAKSEELAKRLARVSDPD
jgi:hypothetical protein